LIFQRKVKRYYPTKLAIELASGLATGASSDNLGVPDEIQSGFLIVETNYRVYAYTGGFQIDIFTDLRIFVLFRLDNKLYLSIIELFCKMLYK